jgi:ABC-type multidrug transport system ATPase subunit
MDLELSEVTKTYRGGVQAVRGVGFRIGSGVLGLVGPNGAGKSSLMKILATITKPSSGSVRWNGSDIAAQPEQLRRVLGYLPQDFGVYPHLTATEFLSYLAAVKGIPSRPASARIQELLDLVNLSDVRKRPLGKYSGGMRQRVGIAQALLNDPRLLIVDEPTAGLDPEERVRFRNLLGELAGDRIVILSTHVVSDIEAVADDIAVMAAGTLRRRGTVGQLLSGVAGSVWETVIAPAELVEFRQHHLTSRTLRIPDGIRVRVLATHPPSDDATSVPADLEDAYLWAVHGSAAAAEVVS